MEVDRPTQQVSLYIALQHSLILLKKHLSIIKNIAVLHDLAYYLNEK